MCAPDATRAQSFSHPGLASLRPTSRAMTSCAAIERGHLLCARVTRASLQRCSQTLADALSVTCSVHASAHKHVPFSDCLLSLLLLSSSRSIAAKEGQPIAVPERFAQLPAQQAPLEEFTVDGLCTQAVEFFGYTAITAAPRLLQPDLASAIDVLQRLIRGEVRRAGCSLKAVYEQRQGSKSR